MGREVRMIAPGWEHPKYAEDHYEPWKRGKYIPLLDRDFDREDAEWSEARAKWLEGLCESYGAGEKWVPIEPEHRHLRYTDYAGERPNPDDYMPKWAPGEATLYVMYEDTSEGTPISPPFETPEALARWLADNDASAFADLTATYDQWLATIKRGSAVSMVLSGGRMQSGVEAMATPAEVAGS